MNGKVVVVTGANTGIGKETALGLARLGATTVISARNRAKGEAAVDEVRTKSGNDDVQLVDLDLASFESIRRAAADIVDRWDRLDVLVNNAGLVVGNRRTTSEGFEMTFGVNHIGPFLLTQLLLDRLKASTPARIVNVSSVAHWFARMRWNDLQFERGWYIGQLAYGQSKLANILFTRELARRLEGTGVTANGLHPGSVRSEFAQGGDTGLLYSRGARLVGALPFSIPPEKGAETSIYLAASPEVDGVTGRYFVRCREARSSSTARSDEAARRLWDITEQLIAGTAGGGAA